MKILIVSLKEAKKRRASIKDQLKEQGVRDFEVVDAVDFRKKSLEEALAFVDGTISKIADSSKRLSAGEIGCALSHLECYRRIQEANYDVALILEDDALLRPSFAKTLDEIQKLPVDYDILLLGHSKLTSEVEERLYIHNAMLSKYMVPSTGRTIGPCWYNYRSGAVGYVVSLQGAEKMLDFTKGKAITVADDWPFFQRAVGLKFFQCRPFVVTEGFEEFESSLRSVPNLHTVNLSKSKVLRYKFKNILRKRVLRYREGIEMTHEC